MKKIALSLLVIAASGAYAFSQAGGATSDDILGPALETDPLLTSGVPRDTANPAPSLDAAAVTPPKAIESGPLLTSGVPRDTTSPAPSLDAATVTPPKALETSATGEGKTDIAETFSSPRVPEPQPLPPSPEPPLPPVAVVTADTGLPEAPAAPVLPAQPAALIDIPIPRPRPAHAYSEPPARKLVTPVAMRVTSGGGYADGAYTGPVVDAYYGLIQIQAIVQGGKLIGIKVLQYPNDRRTSIYINRQALPMLRDEVVQAQSANVDIISGATLTSRAFIRSIGGALKQATGA